MSTTPTFILPHKWGGNLRLILDQAYPAAFNMALDATLFRNHIASKDRNLLLRFYRFDTPSLTVGYGMWRDANSESLQAPAVRRLTGGGIVSHSVTDLTYCFIAPLDSHPQLRKVRESYLLIHQVLKETLASFQIKTELYDCCHSVLKDCPDFQLKIDETRTERSEESRDPSTSPQDDKCMKISYCFDAPVLYDVMLGAAKLAGAGQKRSMGYLMHQGSIAWKLIDQVSEGAFYKRFADELCGIFNCHVILSEAKNLDPSSLRSSG